VEKSFCDLQGNLNSQQIKDSSMKSINKKNMNELLYHVYDNEDPGGYASLEVPQVVPSRSKFRSAKA
jgi:hypothetical protein